MDHLEQYRQEKNPTTEGTGVAFARSIFEALSQSLPQIKSRELVQVRSDSSVADAKLIFAVGRGSDRGILFISPATFPDVVAEEQKKAARMKRHLGDELGMVILSPLAEGRVLDRSYAMMPRLKVLSKNRLIKKFQNRSIKPPLLNWIHAVNDRLSTAAPTTTRFTEALQCLSDLRQADPQIRTAATEALGRLAGAKFHPQTVPMHNDLWTGNVLKSAHPGLEYPFSIIDWRGSEINGFPIYDLLRASMSLGLMPHELRTQLVRATRRLECEPRDAIIYILSALGAIALRPDQLPIDKFLWIARGCLFEIQRALL